MPGEARKRIRIGMAWQILIGLALGIAIGAIFYEAPAVETYLKPIGDIFLRLIKMIVIPIVVSSLIVGVAGSGDIKQVGRLGGKTLIYFEVITTIAIVVGLLIANLTQPGAGIDMSGLNKADISSYVDTSKQVESHGMADIFVNAVPSNIVQAMADGNMLAIIFFSVLFGLGVAAIGERGKPVLAFFNGVADTMFWVTNLVMKFAPFGVFALIGVTVSKFGVSSLGPLLKLLVVVYAAMLLFIFLVFGIVSRLAGISLLQLIRILKNELILAFSTASSEAVLPKIIEKMEKFGVPKDIVSFVVPTGYSFNLDGSTLYQAIVALFIAQMYGMHLDLKAQLTLVLVLMLTSKGIAGVPGASIVVLLATLGTVGIPIEGIMYVLGIERLLDMMRTMVNVFGNSLASIVIARWEQRYDYEKGQRYLQETLESNR